MIKYVIWDFNGTILDDRNLTHQLLNELLIRQNKPPVSLEQYLNIFGFPIKDYYIEAGLDFEVESFEDMAKWFIQVYQPASLKQNLTPYLVETLKELKALGIKNIVLSASEQQNLEEQLNHFNLSQYFDAILGTSNIHAVGKKDVGLNYLEKHKIDPKHCIMIGDTDEDYYVATHLGAIAVLYSGGHQSVNRLKRTTNLIIDNIYDILKLIKNIKEKKSEEIF